MYRTFPTSTAYIWGIPPGDNNTYRLMAGHGCLLRSYWYVQLCSAWQALVSENTGARGHLVVHLVVPIL